jgi:hypothetical protein
MQTEYKIWVLVETHFIQSIDIIRITTIVNKSKSIVCSSVIQTPKGKS